MARTGPIWSQGPGASYGLLGRCRGPNNWPFSAFCHFISRGLDPKWSSWDLNACSLGCQCCRQLLKLLCHSAGPWSLWLKDASFLPKCLYYLVVVRAGSTIHPEFQPDDEGGIVSVEQKVSKFPGKVHILDFGGPRVSVATTQLRHCPKTVVISHEKMNEPGLVPLMRYIQYRRQV